MSRLLAGSIIILFLLVCNFVAAFIQTGATSTSSLPGCDPDSDADECEAVGKTTFVKAVTKTTIQGIDGAPDFFNAAWLLIGFFLLVLGLLLIAMSFIPTTS